MPDKVYCHKCRFLIGITKHQCDHNRNLKDSYLAPNIEFKDTPMRRNHDNKCKNYEEAVFGSAFCSNCDWFMPSSGDCVHKSNRLLPTSDSRRFGFPLCRRKPEELNRFNQCSRYLPKGD